MKNQITIAAAMVLGCAAAAHGADVTSPGGQITVHADVIDVTDLKVNGETDRITLGTDEVPIIGELTLTTGA